jgi:hypothetical protein
MHQSENQPIGSTFYFISPVGTKEDAMGCSYNILECAERKLKMKINENLERKI